MRASEAGPAEAMPEDPRPKPPESPESPESPDPSKDQAFRDKMAERRETAETLDLKELKEAVAAEAAVVEMVVEEVMSEVELEGGLDSFIPKPPDGGWGWVIVLASFLANLVVDGIAYSFGVFLPEFAKHYGVSQGVTALVGSLLTGTYLLVGPVVSGLVNQWGSRAVMIAGSVVGTAAIFLSVFSPSIVILMLSFGICGGIGFGLIYLPAIVHVGLYFERKRALATGLAVAGSGVGTFVFAPLSVVLIDEFGWQGAIWVLSGLVLNCAIFGSLLRPVLPERDPDDLQIEIQGENERYQATLSDFNLHQAGSVLSVDATSLKNFRDRTLSAGSIRNITRATHASSVPTKIPESKSLEGKGPDPGRHDKARNFSVVSESGSTEQGAELKSGALGGQLRVLKEDERISEDDPLVDVPPSRHASTATGANRRLSNSHKPSQQSGISGVSGVSGVSSHSSQDKQSQGATETQLRQRRNTAHRVSARSFASSISRLPTMTPNLAANSLQTLGSLQSGDFRRPLYRQDIFFPGSLASLPQYRASRGDLSVYRQSTISIPQGVAEVEEVELDGAPALLTLREGALDPGHCLWLPRSVRAVLFEMMGLDLLRKPVMMLLCISNVFGMLGFYSPFVFISAKALAETGCSRQDAALLLSLIGVTNTLGRVVFGWLSDRGWVSALAISNACLFVCAGLTLLLPLFSSYPALVVYGALFGFTVSAFISLSSIILVDYLGLENLSNSFGLLILARGMAAMVGSPLGGLVYDATDSYNASFLYSGAMLATSALVSTLIHFLHLLPESITDRFDSL